MARSGSAGLGHFLQMSACRPRAVAPSRRKMIASWLGFHRSSTVVLVMLF